MGQFRFTKKFITFDINGHIHKLEQNDDFLIIWSEIAKDMEKFPETIQDLSPRGQIEKHKQFFRSHVYDRLFGGGAYDEDFSDVALSSEDLNELLFYLSTEVNNALGTRYEKYQNQGKKPKTKPAKRNA